MLLVSGMQQSDSDVCVYLYMCVCVYFLFHVLFHFGLLQDVEYSALCCTVGPRCLSILFIVSANPKLLIYPFPHPSSPLVTN